MNAFIFPGQGSQFIGMGKDHYVQNAAFRKIIDRATELLEYDLKSIMFDGPEEVLRQTEHTQPAIFMHSVALFSTLNAKPDMVAGHSLGEFSALVASKAVSFEDALIIVKKRGSLMQKAGKENPGTMAAVIGMEDSIVEDVCTEASSITGKPVVPANYNSIGQLVISGFETAIDQAIRILQDRGCKLAKKLPVSGAFHSSLMKPAYDGLQINLETLKITEPVCPIYSNYKAEPANHPDEIRSNLLNQLLNPVRWTQTIIRMQKDGARKFTEVGPGKVLSGLVKRTLSDIETEGFQ